MLILPGTSNPYQALQVSLTNEYFSLASRRIWDFVEKFFPFLLSIGRVTLLKNIVMSRGYSNYRFAGTAIAFMIDKKGRGNGDNSRDHSSYEPSKTGCTVRNLYLRRTHLPNSVSGYRKRLVKKGIRTPPPRLSQDYLSVNSPHPPGL
jgi:hypothetical protein